MSIAATQSSPTPKTFGQTWQHEIEGAGSIAGGISNREQPLPAGSFGLRAVQRGGSAAEKIEASRDRTAPQESTDKSDGELSGMPAMVGASLESNAEPGIALPVESSIPSTPLVSATPVGVAPNSTLTAADGRAQVERQVDARENGNTSNAVDRPVSTLKSNPDAKAPLPLDGSSATSTQMEQAPVAVAAVPGIQQNAAEAASPADAVAMHNAGNVSSPAVKPDLSAKGVPPKTDSSAKPAAVTDEPTTASSAPPASVAIEPDSSAKPASPVEGPKTISPGKRPAEGGDLTSAAKGSASKAGVIQALVASVASLAPTGDIATPASGIGTSVAGTISLAAEAIAPAHLQTSSAAAEPRLDMSAAGDLPGIKGHQLLASGPAQLDVGVFDGTHGWVSIRAELGASGMVSASLTASAAAHESLRAALPEMASYLESEAVNVSKIAVHRIAQTPSLNATGPDQQQSNGHAQGQKGGGMQDTGGLMKDSSSGGRQEPDSQAAAKTSIGPVKLASGQSVAGAAGAVDWIRASQAMPGSASGFGRAAGSSGHWLNVSA
jgi:hypothetical protein